MEKFLSAYINQRDGRHGSYIVSIQEEIQRYKRRNRGKQPLIVFSSVSTQSLTIKDGEEYLCGGRHANCLRLSEMIFQKLKEFGADLAFFVNRPVQEDKYPVWVQWTNGKYRKNEKVFQSLRDDTKHIYYYAKKRISSYSNNLYQMAKKYGEIFISLENDSDMDVAAYATKNRAMAIFANYTDFLIMPGDWQVWLIDKFRLRGFTTIGWNKSTLRQSLNLKQNQMPIFAILCGNDAVPYSSVQHINNPTKDKSGTQPKLVTELIRKEFPNGVPLSKRDIEKISELIYHDGESDYTMGEIRVMVKEGIDFYDYSTLKSNSIEPKWLKDHIDETNSTIVYILYKGLSFSISQTLIDLSIKGTKPFSELVIPIVRRQMGIVLFEQKSKDIYRFIYHKPSHEEPFQRRPYKPIYPEFDVPNIDEILKNEKKTELSVNIDDKIKFDILCWILSPSKKPLKYENCVEIVDTIYFIPNLILNYLVTESQITIDEADVILLTIGTSYALPAEKADLLTPPTKYTERPFWLSFLFTQLILHFINTLHVSGLSKLIKPDYFDGFIFHKMYSTYLAMDCVQKKDLMQPYETYRLYAK